MTTTPKILAFAGSTRKNSFNKLLVKIAANGAQKAGASVTVIDLKDYPLPIFDEDLEAEGVPENALKLKELMQNHHGFLIASPEYNSSISPLLKNVIDWTSRPYAKQPPLICYTGKVASLLSTSPGALGGIRGLVTVRSILGNINTIVLPEQFVLPFAMENFTSEGSIKDPKLLKNAENIGKSQALFLSRYLD